MMKTKMDSIKRVLLIIVLINISLMLLVNIIIYVNISQPLYYNDGGEGIYTTTALDHFKGDSNWCLAIPVLSCVILIISIRFGWLSILSALMSLTFWFAASPPGLIDIPEVGAGGDMIYLMSALSIMLCGIRFVIVIIQYVLRKNLLYKT